jgi:hypothetical protein
LVDEVVGLMVFVVVVVVVVVLFFFGDSVETYVSYPEKISEFTEYAREGPTWGNNLVPYFDFDDRRSQQRNFHFFFSFFLLYTFIIVITF